MKHLLKNDEAVCLVISWEDSLSHRTEVHTSQCYPSFFSNTFESFCNDFLIEVSNIISSFSFQGPPLRLTKIVYDTMFIISLAIAVSLFLIRELEIRKKLFNFPFTPFPTKLLPLTTPQILKKEY